LLSLALTCGCTNSTPDSEPTDLESWSAEDEAKAVAAAEQAVRDWWRVHSQCLADPPNTEPSCFEEVAVDEALADDIEDLQTAQEYGVRYTGERRYVRTERVVEVRLNPGFDKEILISVCQDNQDFDILDSDGKSMFPSDSPIRFRRIWMLRNYVGTWLVAGIFEDPEGSTC